MQGEAGGPLKSTKNLVPVSRKESRSSVLNDPLFCLQFFSQHQENIRIIDNSDRIFTEKKDTAFGYVSLA